MDLLNQIPLEKLHRQARSACAIHQRGLSCTLQDDKVVLEGEFRVQSLDTTHSSMVPLATYEIRLELYMGYPRKEPKLFEIGGTIPQNSTHHVNPDGSCCYGVWEAIIAEKPDLTISDLLEGQIKSYFFGQHYFVEKGEWPFDEYDHGGPGIVQSCSQLFGCPADKEIVRSLLILLSRKWKRDRHPCPCRSGKRLKECCRPYLDAVPQRHHYKRIRPLLDRFNAFHP